MTNLLEAKMGKWQIIDCISDKASNKIRRRLLELGFTCSEKVRVVRKSLLGKAYLIEIRGFCLTLRKDIAQLILIK